MYRALLLALPLSLVAAPAVGAAESTPASGAAGAPATYTRNAAVVVYEGVEILDFAGPAEVLAVAGGFAADRTVPALRVYTVGASRKPVLSQGFVTIVPEFSIDDAPRPDIVVIPGGASASLRRDERFMAWFKGLASTSQVLTVCTGAFVPADAGLLDGLDATTYYLAVEGLRGAAPKARVHEGRRFVDNGRIITTAGVSAGIDGALHLVARLFGRYVADRTARYMEYHWTPEPYLAKAYALFNPSLDDAGRERQQAQVLEDEGQRAQAIASWRRIAERDPGDAFAALRLGEMLVFEDRPADAIPFLRRGAEAPDAPGTVNGEAWHALGCALAATGKVDDALAALESAFAAGITRRYFYEQEPRLAPLRENERFKRLLAKTN